MYNIPSLDMNDALAIQTEVLTLANQRECAVAICVVDARPVQLAAICMDGVKTPSVRTAYAKAITVVEFQRPTRKFRSKLDPNSKSERWIPAGKDGWDDEDLRNATAINPTFASWPGGVPILNPFNGKILGGLGISNLSAEEDHDLAAAAIESWSSSFTWPPES